jgi:hypothetical protein
LVLSPTSCAERSRVETSSTFHSSEAFPSDWQHPKVLPALYSREPDRLRRLEQEAQAGSALNHPGILTIHGFGEHQGAPYIVTELLEA